MVSVRDVKTTVEKINVYNSEFNNIDREHKTGFFKYLFPTEKEKTMCVAVFDAMYSEGGYSEQRKFIESVVDDENENNPLKINKSASTYETSKKIAQVYLANKENYERILLEEKLECGQIQSTSFDQGGQNELETIVMSMPSTIESDIVKKKIKNGRRRKIERVSLLDLETARNEMRSVKEYSKKQKEDELMKKYEMLLQQRIAKLQKEKEIPEYQMQQSMAMSR